VAASLNNKRKERELLARARHLPPPMPGFMEKCKKKKKMYVKY
jgi:hypothetical protein